MCNALIIHIASPDVVSPAAATLSHTAALPGAAAQLREADAVEALLSAIQVRLTASYLNT